MKHTLSTVLQNAKASFLDPNQIHKWEIAKEEGTRRKKAAYTHLNSTSGILSLKSFLYASTEQSSVLKQSSWKVIISQAPELRA